MKTQTNLNRHFSRVKVYKASRGDQNKRTINVADLGYRSIGKGTRLIFDYDSNPGSSQEYATAIFRSNRETGKTLCNIGCALPYNLDPEVGAPVHIWVDLNSIRFLTES